MKEIEYKRSKDGKFAPKTAAELANTELVRSSVMASFVKSAGTGIVKEGIKGSPTAGALATRGTLARTIGGIVGEKLGGTKGQSIGKIVGGTLAGGLSAGVPGAVAEGVAAVVGLKDANQKSLFADLDRINRMVAENRQKTKLKTDTIAPPALVAIDKAIKNAQSQGLEKATVIRDKIGSELDKAGLTDVVDSSLRTSGAGATSGTIKAAIAGTKILTGVAEGVAGAGMTVGAIAGGKLGKQLGGSDGEVAGSTIGGAIGGAVSAVLATGGVGIVPGMAIGSAVGLSMVSPNKIVSTASAIGNAASQLAKSKAGKD